MGFEHDTEAINQPGGLDGKVQNLSQSRVQYALSALKTIDGLHWASSSDCEESVQSPTISSIDSNSSYSANSNDSLQNQKPHKHHKMKKDLEEALEKIKNLEELLKQ